MIDLRRAVGRNGHSPAHSVGQSRPVWGCRPAWGCCPACRRSDQVDGGRRPVARTRRCRSVVAELSACLMVELSADPIQCLRPASVGPPVVQICSVADRIRWLDVRIRWLDVRTGSVDARIRWKAVRIHPDCHRSSPTRLNRASRNGRSMVRRICFSMGSGPIRHLIGRSRTAQASRTAQPHRAVDPTGSATPTVALARPGFPERRAPPSRLGQLHHCFAGPHLAPSSPSRPASALAPGSGNRQCHAGAENQTVFEGS
jgi:hypothetical protein